MKSIINNYEIKCDNLRITGGKLNLVIRDRKFNYNCIIKIISAIDRISLLNYTCILNLIIKSEEFRDDASIVILENVIYDTIINKNIDIKIRFDKLKKGRLGYFCFKKSILNKSIINNLFNKNIFIDLFKQTNFIEGETLRKYLKYEKTNEIKNKNLQSIVVQDVYYFLKNLDFTVEYSKNISIALSEIIDNVFSHAKSDAILSIKVTNVVNREKVEKKAVFVCILNISDILLHTTLKEKYYNKTLEEKSHMIVSTAYNNNVSKFNKTFDENSFWFTSVFQKYVTTRTNTSGGTGLTNLIKNLIDRSYEDFCYVISGDNCLYFRKELLKLNNDGTIGFNDTNDYFNHIPNPNALFKLRYHLNGTLFSLIFIS